VDPPRRDPRGDPRPARLPQLTLAQTSIVRRIVTVSPSSRVSVRRTERPAGHHRGRPVHHQPLRRLRGWLSHDTTCHAVGPADPAHRRPGTAAALPRAAPAGRAGMTGRAAVRGSRRRRRPVAAAVCGPPVMSKTGVPAVRQHPVVGGWRWRESNPRPSTHHQGFSERSLPRLYSTPPITQTSRCDGPSRCLVSRTRPRPARAVSHLADARIRADDEPGLTDPPSYRQAARAKSARLESALVFFATDG